MLRPDGSMPTQRQINRLTQVGNICAQWSNLEYQFAHVIWVLLALDMDTGAIVTGGLDMLPRANMAINLARHLQAPRELITALEKARKQIQDGLDVRRNRAVHGVQFYHEGGDDLYVEVHRGKGGRGRKLLPDQELADLGREIHNVSFELAQATIGTLESLKVALATMAANMRTAASDAVSPNGS